MNMGALKMACLAYNPSQIVYRNRLYTRKELIEAKRDLLQGVKREKELELYSALNSARNHRPNTSMRISSRRWRGSMSPVSTTLPTPFLKTPEELALKTKNFDLVKPRTSEKD